MMNAGELFGIGVDVPAGKSALSIVYLQADGSAVELYRGTAAPGSPASSQRDDRAERQQGDAVSGWTALWQ